jgi:predicted deacetylase
VLKPAPGLLLIALHDVTPAHAARLERAERLFAALGIGAAAYLLVPDYHSSAPAHRDPSFVAWCRAPRPYRVEWFLHGFEHRESAPRAEARRPPPVQRFARRFLTAGEGEFLALRGRQLDDRLHAGIVSFRRAMDAAPAGFIAPAWLYNDELAPALARHGMRITESHFHVLDVVARRALPAPVITWASRSGPHRAGSLVAARAARELWRRRPVVRIAVHPGDFDHPRLVDSLARAIDDWRRDRAVVSYAEACPAPAGSA